MPKKNPIFQTPFGSSISEMSFSSDTLNKYRYGFNNQEKDGELGDYYAFEYRMQDARLGRFLSVDPLTKDYPWYSPYQFAGNIPILAKDMEGLEPAPNNRSTAKTIPALPISNAFKTSVRQFMQTGSSTPPVQYATVPTFKYNFAVGTFVSGIKYVRPELSETLVGEGGLIEGGEALSAVGSALRRYIPLGVALFTPMTCNEPNLFYSNFNLKVPQTIPDPAPAPPITAPAPSEQPQTYSVYETQRNLKTGKNLPYFGISMDPNTRYTPKDIEYKFMKRPFIAQNLQYDYAKGVEANLIALNNPFYPASARYSPLIDNMDNSVNPFGVFAYRLMLGRVWLEVYKPNWKTDYYKGSTAEDCSNTAEVTSTTSIYTIQIQSASNTCPEPPAPTP